MYGCFGLMYVNLKHTVRICWFPIFQDASISKQFDFLLGNHLIIFQRFKKYQKVLKVKKMLILLEIDQINMIYLIKYVFIFKKNIMYVMVWSKGMEEMLIYTK